MEKKNNQAFALMSLVCGYGNTDTKDLSVRGQACQECSVQHDRDCPDSHLWRQSDAKPVKQESY